MQKSQEAAEQEKIKLSLLSDSISIGDEKGKKLYDKTIENGSKWDVIITNSDKKTYGTGWTYLAKGSDMEGETLKNNWLINDETGEMIKLEENSYVELSYNSSVGVTDGLIFNLDPSIIEGAKNQEEIENMSGENVQYINFDWDENSGINNKAFRFDGLDDYIRIGYTNELEKRQLVEQGFTYEFYGICYNDTDKYAGLFCLGEEKAERGRDEFSTEVWNREES